MSLGYGPGDVVRILSTGEVGLVIGLREDGRVDVRLEAAQVVETTQDDLELHR